MNYNRNKERPEDRSRILLIIPQPVGIVGLGKSNISRRHENSLLGRMKRSGLEPCPLKLGILSQATGADNLGSHPAGVPLGGQRTARPTSMDAKHQGRARHSVRTVDFREDTRAL